MKRTNNDSCFRRTYRPTDYVSSLVLIFSAAMIGNVNEQMAKIAKHAIRDIKSGRKELSNPLGLFFCNPTKEMQSQLRNYEDSLSSGNLANLSYEDKKLLRELRIGTSQLKELYAKVEELVTSFFDAKTGAGAMLVLGIDEDQSPNRYLFNQNQKASDIETWSKKITIESMDFIYEKMGLVGIGNVTPSQDAIKSLHLNDDSIRQMSCFCYALMMLDLETAKVFTSGRYPETQLDFCLTQNGWRPVNEPNDGDIVLYYNHVQKKVMHAGIYREDGMVESKPGINNPTVYRHGLFDVLGLYGTSVYFMRKSKAVI